MNRQPEVMLAGCTSFIAISIAAVLLLPSMLRAARKGSNWVEVRSPHFIVESNSGRGRAKAVAKQFEMVRDVLNHIFPQEKSPQEGLLTVLAVNSGGTMKELLPRYFHKRGQAHPAGIFTQSLTGPYIVLRTDLAYGNIYDPAFHEYTHYFMRRELPYMPLWLSEGLADLFSTIRFEEHDALMGVANPYDFYMLKEQSMIPLRTLLTVDHSSPYYNRSGKVSIFYAESWALTHYLLLSDVRNRTRHVQEYVLQVANGGDTVKSFVKIFGPLDSVREALDKYVRQFTLPAFKLPLTEHVSPQNFAVRKISLAEADAGKAEFLLARGNTRKAEVLVSKALKQNPQLGQANALMGLLLIEKGEDVEAAKWTRKAIQLDPNNFRAYLFAAMTMPTTHLPTAASAELESNLKKALALRPCLVSADSMLTKLYLSQKGKGAEALAAAADAVRCKPEDDSLLSNLIVALLKQQKLARAVRIELRMLARAHAPKEKARVRNNLGWSLLQTNIDTVRADHEIRTAAKLAPKASYIQDSLGYLLLKEKDLPAAEAAFRHALSIQPKLVSSLHGLGNVLRSENETDAAITEYRKALAIAPNNDEIHYDLSLALKARGDLTQATSELKAARKINPYNPAYQ